MRFGKSIIVPIIGVLVTFMSTTSVTADLDKPGTEGTEPMTYIDSSAEAYEAMAKLPTDEPLHMLNMIRFKDIASYDEDSKYASKGWTGEQAYREYGRLVSPITNRQGGKTIYFGQPQLTVIGPEHENWDAIFIVQYPNFASFMGLLNDPSYKEHAFHRSAAVADSRLIRMTPPTE